VFDGTESNRDFGPNLMGSTIWEETVRRVRVVLSDLRERRSCFFL
jgi:hypothetical protein